MNSFGCSIYSYLTVIVMIIAIYNTLPIGICWILAVFKSGITNTIWDRWWPSSGCKPIRITLGANPGISWGAAFSLLNVSRIDFKCMATAWHTYSRFPLHFPCRPHSSLQHCQESIQGVPGKKQELAGKRQKCFLSHALEQHAVSHSAGLLASPPLSIQGDGMCSVVVGCFGGVGYSGIAISDHAGWVWVELSSAYAREVSTRESNITNHIGKALMLRFDSDRRYSEWHSPPAYSARNACSPID